MRLIARSFLVVVIAAIALPASAIKIVPGTYKLTWDERREFADPLWAKYAYEGRPPSGCLNPSPRPIYGAASKRAIFGSTGEHNVNNFPAVLDESKGTGKGYDTIYLGEAGSYPWPYDVKVMTRIPLTKHGNALEARGYLARVPNGKLLGNSGPKRRFDVRVEPEGDKTSYRVSVYVRGAWRGAIKTDEGQVAIRLIDSDGLDKVDRVILACADTEATIRVQDDHVTLSLEKPQAYDNTVYVMSFDSSCGRLMVGPYKGPMGTVVVNPVDGYGSLLKKGCAWFSDDRASSSLSYHILGKQSLSLPAGMYGSVRLYLYTGKVSESQQLMLSLEMPAVRVTAGKTVTMNAGGPLKFKMSADKDVFTGKRYIACTPYFPGVKTCDVSGVKRSLVLKDLNGNVVYSESKGPEDFDWPFRFDIPPSLKPGSYAALLTVDLQPYDRKKVFGAKLRIE